MKIICHCIIALCLFSVACAFYTDMDDSIDIDSIVQNPTEYRKYMDCFLNKKSCTETIMGFKKHIRDALLDDCAQCTLKDKHIAEKFSKALEKNPEDLAQLKALYDPEGKYYDRLSADMAKY